MGWSDSSLRIGPSALLSDGSRNSRWITHNDDPDLIDVCAPLVISLFQGYAYEHTSHVCVLGPALRWTASLRRTLFLSDGEHDLELARQRAKRVRYASKRRRHLHRNAEAVRLILIHLC